MQQDLKSNSPSPVTQAAIMRKVSGMLQAAGLDDSAWQARVLVAHALALKPGELHLLSDAFIDDAHQGEIFTLARQLISGKPLQHVIGEWDFFGRTFKVDARALIPRPETELMVDFITSCHLPSEPLMADAGTGSGIIGISLALEVPDSLVIGTDISPEAISLANENKRLLNAGNYLPVHCDLIKPLNAQFDVIAANLPYIPSKDITALDSLVKNHDPLLALDGGIDGILLILKAITDASNKLRSNGLLVLETGYDQELSVTSLFKNEFWINVQAHKDLAGNHRMVTARRR